MTSWGAEKPTPAAAMATPNTSVLVVDDDTENLSLMLELLETAYRVAGATNGEEALRIARGDSPPDLIVLDIMMPGMSGYEVCAALKADAATRDIPVIFLTGRTEAGLEARGLRMGAVDYITKPVSPAIFLARIKVHLENKAARDFLANRNALLEREVHNRTREITEVQDATIVLLASIVETRDNETGDHIRRTQHYVRALARQLQSHPDFAEYLTDHQIDILFKSSPLHDIGKVGIPDRILLKPGKLEAGEYEIMKTHTTLGHKAIEDAERHLGMKVDFLACAKEIALNHQEKWDGSGYPRKLSGTDIPISARLMALADVYDALISGRVYKPAFTHDEATKIIIDAKGSHFDPAVVDAFTEVATEFRNIAQRYSG
jgi:putative two-component system response regulator